jgi:hypothetical protein
MADLIHGAGGELNATKQDLIAALVQRELKFSAKLSPYFTDVSSFAVKGAKTISFPKLSSFTATNRAAGAAGDAAVISSTVDTLDLNQTPYLAWIVDPNENVESVLDFELAAAQRAASAHGRFVDNAIITELETVGVATTTAGAISKSIILEMRASYIKRFGMISDSVLIVSPDDEAVLLAINDFVHAELYGSAVIPNGVIGRLYGIQVVVHEALVANQYYLAGKDGLAYGFQRSPTLSSQGANEFGAGAMRTALEQKFGVKGLQLGQAGVGPTLSALVVKDNN